MSPGIRVLTAITIECGWEVVENTTWIIDKYRESTVSLEYYGDSIVNSVADIGACALGYWMVMEALRRKVPVWAIAVAVVVVEVGLALWIRDNLTMNILALTFPIDAVSAWQAGGAP